jgi:hypothetical protein
MKLTKKINISLIVTISFFIFSMLVSTIPCQKAPSVPPLTYAWTVCNLNPDNYLSFEGNLLFLGYTESLAETYIIVLIAIFLISFAILNIKRRKD